MWDLSQPTRDQTCAPCIRLMESQPLDRREVPMALTLNPQQLTMFCRPVMIMLLKYPILFLISNSFSFFSLCCIYPWVSETEASVTMTNFYSFCPSLSEWHLLTFLTLPWWVGLSFSLNCPVFLLLSFTFYFRMRIFSLMYYFFVGTWKLWFIAF